MRSRPRIKLYFASETLLPGQLLRATLVLNSRSRTPYDAIEVELHGHEQRLRTTSSINGITTPIHHERSIVALARQFPAGVLEAGQTPFLVMFTIPADAPPSHRSDLGHVSYELRVRVRIPWWLDRDHTYAVTVAPPPSAARAPHPLVYTTQAEDLTNGEPILEISLDDAAIARGSRLHGALAVQLGSRILRRIDLELLTLETARVPSQTAVSEIERVVWTLHEGSLDDGKPLPFTLLVPESARPAMVTPFIQIAHQLRVVAIIVLGKDVELRVPLRWFHADDSAEHPVTVPSVGDERRYDVWQRAIEELRRSGVADARFDDARERASFHVDQVEVSIREDRSEKPPRLEARFEYPPLGLEIRVGERAKLMRSLPATLAPDRRRLRVSARDVEQAESWLYGKLTAALLAFDQVEMDDSAVVVSRTGGVYQLRGLLLFLQHALALAEALAAVQIPAPRALESAVPAFQTFAQVTGCRLCAGDLSLRDWTLRGISIDLEHRFEAGDALASRLWTRLPPNADVDAWTLALRNESTDAVIVESARIGYELPLVRDPMTARESAEALARAASRMSGALASGPYR